MLLKLSKGLVGTRVLPLGYPPIDLSRRLSFLQLTHILLSYLGFDSTTHKPPRFYFKSCQWPFMVARRRNNVTWFLWLLIILAAATGHGKVLGVTLVFFHCMLWTDRQEPDVGVHESHWQPLHLNKLVQAVQFLAPKSSWNQKMYQSLNTNIFKCSNPRRSSVWYNEDQV